MTPARRTEPIPPSLRKPPSVARESFQQTNTGSAQGKDTGTVFSGKRGRPKLPRHFAQSFENIEHVSCLVNDPAERWKIIDKLIRLIEAKDRKNPNRPKYDPLAIWRLASQHLGVTQQTVVYVAQRYILESLKWRRFVRVDLPLVMTRADEAANAVWQKRSA